MAQYRKRLCEARITQLAQHFKIVLLVGARQVGKSSLLAHLFPSIQTFVFDPVQDLYNARKDPDLFLTSFPAPLILDEIQYVPALLPSLKRKVDQEDQYGQYLITGSQQFSVLKTITESLAGRVAIMELGPMTLHEMYGSPIKDHWLSRYLQDAENFQKNFRGILPKLPSVYNILWRGTMPGTIDIPNNLLPTYFSSYMQTYVERDIRLVENIEDIGLFSRFFSLLGALTAQEINYSQLGREIGITPATAKKWLNLLLYSYQWYEIWPYHGNAIKRISQKSKGFLSDTGMACYLQRFPSADSLAGHPLMGALFESFCVSIIRGLCSSLDTMPILYHWRTAGGAEIDLILEYDGKLFPIEMKCKTNITRHDARSMQAFRATYPQKTIMPGIILYAGTECYMIDEHTIALPWQSI